MGFFTSGHKSNQKTFSKTILLILHRILSKDLKKRFLLKLFQYDISLITFKNFNMNKLGIISIVFIALISCKGRGSGPLVRDSFTNENKIHNTDNQNNKSKVHTEKVKVTVEPCDGCVTISNLLSNKNTYSGKVIKVKGIVTKYNPEIMGKNWVHIQDGTEFNGGFDLTVTTGTKVTVGEIVTFEGKIALDKDFGYGYSYTVLMEEGSPVK
jgi:hypothetical protein